MKTLTGIKKLISTNLKTLMIFEVVYRILGILLILPLVRLLFFASIRLAGFQYITNQMIFSYLTQWTTVFFLLVLILVFSIYVFVELVFLSIIYDYSYHNEKISFQKLLMIGIKQSFILLKRYKLLILVPSVFMFFIFEAFHIVGFASTISGPRILIEEVANLLVWQFLFYVGMGLLALLFVESMFFVKLYTLESMPFKQTIVEHRMLLKQSRLKYLGKFLLFNFLLNGLLFTIYALIFSFIGFLIFITRGQAIVLGSLLTIIYSFYLIVTMLTSLVLIPLNYALISVWYYQKRPKAWINEKYKSYQKRTSRLMSNLRLKPIVLILFLGLVLLNITNVVSIVREPHTPVELLKRAEIIAHRGASLSAPENTLSAIEKAIEQGAEGIEFDVQMSLDGVPVLMHDTTLGRTTNDLANRRVDQLSLAELKSLDAGSWFSEDFKGEPVPTLEEVLKLIDGRAMAYIDLKARGELFNQEVVRLIESLELERKSVVMSFSYQQLVEIKNLNEDIQTLLLISTFFGDIDALIRDDVIDNFAFRTFVIANNPDYVRQVQQAGKRVYVWTLEETTQHQQFIEYDVDGLITKDPILARELVYSRNTPTLFTEILRELFTR